LEKQLNSQATAVEMLAEIPKTCSIGVKTNSKGHESSWRGYKLHLDTGDGQIPLTAVLTGASVHDSQVAIPLMKITSARATHLYELMDSAYDAASIHAMSARLFHVAIIDPKTQLPCRVKPIPVLDPPEVIRYRERTMTERVNGRLSKG
jgi:Transposase DDE domain